MGSVPAPNIAQEAGEIAAAPLNHYAEYTRAAALQQQTQQSAAMAPLAQEQARQQIESQRRQFADQDALTKALTQYDPQKHTVEDFPKLITSNGGSGQAALNAQAGLVKKKQDLLKLSDDQFSHEQTIADLTAGIHDAVTSSPDDQKQDVYTRGMARLAGAGVDVSKEPAQYPGDEEFAKHLPAIRLHSAVLKEANEARELNAKEWKEAGPGQLINTRTGDTRGTLRQPVDQQELASYLKNPDVDKGTPLAKRDAATFAAWKAKLNPMGLVMGNQLGTPGMGSAIDQAAERYSKDGTLPAGFSRSPGTIAAIIKRSAELHPDQDLASNRATFKADESALKKVQGQFDTMTAFENTALKNIDLFLEKARAVPDLGARFANVPLRMITGKMIGEEKQAALETARIVASREAAKVLTSATGSGVLSDTQAKEVDDIVNGNMPLPAMISTVETLKADMQNRQNGYQQDINAIRGRLGAKPQGAAGQGAGKVEKGSVITQNGHRYKVTAVDANGKVTAADPI